MSGQCDNARVFMGLDDEHVESFRALWVPEIQARVTDIRSRHTNAEGIVDMATFSAEITGHNLEDAHWDWGRKWDILQPDLSKVFFAVECEGKVEAFMIVDNSKYRCRRPEQDGGNLIYIEFVAIAPWNRKALVEQPLYRGIGKALVGTAISLSIEEEYDGRIGLHSLPQSETFYKDTCGMADLGPDDDKKMNYYEMTAEEAATFLKTVGMK